MSSPAERMNETDLERFHKLFDEYMRLGHAIQSGIAHKIELDKKFATPKDLRVGVDMRAVDHGGLVELLIQKGIFTDVEYMEALVKAGEREKLRWEAEISALLGAKVTLA